MPWNFVKCIIVALLLSSGGSVAAQSAADQSFKAIPQQVKESGENKATTKTTTVSNSAMNQLDSVSGKALKGFTNMFKKKNKAKNKNSGGDSSVIRPADSLSTPPKTTSRAGRLSSSLTFCGIRRLGANVINEVKPSFKLV
jgi:hypothetical protein